MENVEILNFKWVMLALSWLVYFAFGMVLSALPPLVTPIVLDLGLSYAQVGFILGTVLLLYIPLALPVGIFIDRFGTKVSITVGIAVVSLSGVLQSLSTNFEMLFLSVAIFGLGGSFLSVGLPKVVASWFAGKRRGLASGVYITGAFVGSSTAIAITNPLMVPLVGTWRNVLVAYGLLGFLMTLLWSFFGRRVKRIRMDYDSTLTLRESISKLMREKLVWTVAIIGFSAFFVGYGFERWLPKYFEFNGMRPDDAGVLAAIPGWCGLIGSIVVPSLREAGSRKALVLIMIMIQGICISIVGVTVDLPQIASLVFYGITSAALPPLLIVILMDMPHIGAEYMGAASGIIFSVGAIGGFLGPSVVGFIIDLTGSMLPSILLLAVVIELMMIPALYVKEE